MSSEYFVQPSVITKARMSIFLLLDNLGGEQTRQQSKSWKPIGVGFFIGPSEAVTAKHCFEGSRIFFSLAVSHACSPL